MLTFSIISTVAKSTLDDYNRYIRFVNGNNVHIKSKLNYIIY